MLRHIILHFSLSPKNADRGPEPKGINVKQQVDSCDTIRLLRVAFSYVVGGATEGAKEADTGCVNRKCTSLAYHSGKSVDVCLYVYGSLGKLPEFTTIPGLLSFFSDSGSSWLR